MAARPDPTSSKPPLVGFEADMNKIMNAMVDTSVKELSVVAIIGPRSVGKTYLAKEIYTSPEVRRHFDVHVWLSFANYRVRDWPQSRMREQLSIEDRADISNFLRGKRYCVVIDDLRREYYSSHKVAWHSILEELPENNNGSRVLVTGRPDYRECWDDPTIPILQYEVGPRSNEESLEMLLQAAFPKDPWDGCPAGEVDDLAMKFVRKCEGLPWPLRFLGGLLSERPWSEVLGRIEAIEATGESFVHFAMRYRGLPTYQHKIDFLYFLTFPEGADIHAESLVRMLEAEGQNFDLRFLSPESILEELADRSMIEVTKRYSNGSIKCYRLHDPLLRLLAIHEAKEKRFVLADENCSILDLFNAGIKLKSYMAKVNHKFDGKFMDVAQLADASCCFNFGENFPLEISLVSNLSNLRLFLEILEIKGYQYLTTLVVRDTTIEILPSIELLPSLGYLSLRNTKVREIPKLPESLTTLDMGGTPIETLPDASFCPNLTTIVLKNTKVREIPESFTKLEYLDVRNTFVRFLPDSLWRKLKSVLATNTLQHLDGPPTSFKENNIKRYLGRRPRNDFTSQYDRLETLETVHVAKDWAKCIPRFHSGSSVMKKLGLSYFQNDFTSDNALDWKIITRILVNLDNLSSLKVQGSNVPAKIIDVPTCPSYEKKLKNLSVGGSYSLFSLSGIEVPPMLITLTLENFEFEEDPMPILGKLKHLKTLRLRWLLYSAQTKRMICTNGEFPQLETMQIYHISGLEEWSVEEGALPEITHVVIECCKKLKNLSGPLVDRTTPLKELHLHAMPPGFTTKFSHLPFVKITENYI